MSLRSRVPTIVVTVAIGALIFAIMPAGEAAATSTRSPGQLLGIDDESTFTITVYNDSKKEVTVSFDVINAAGFTGTV